MTGLSNSWICDNRRNDSRFMSGVGRGTYQADGPHQSGPDGTNQSVPHGTHQSGPYGSHPIEEPDAILDAYPDAAGATAGQGLAASSNVTIIRGEGKKSRTDTGGECASSLTAKAACGLVSRAVGAISGRLCYLPTYLHANTLRRPF